MKRTEHIPSLVGLDFLQLGWILVSLQEDTGKDTIVVDKMQAVIQAMSFLINDTLSLFDMTYDVKEMPDGNIEFMIWRQTNALDESRISAKLVLFTDEDRWLNGKHQVDISCPPQ